MFKKVFAICFVLLLVTLGCVSSKDKKNAAGPAATQMNSPESPDEKQGFLRQGVVTGTVRQKGNAPHAEMVIYGYSNLEEDGPYDFKITGPMAPDLAELLYKKVEARGKITKKVLRLAGGSDRGRIHYIIDVETFSIPGE